MAMALPLVFALGGVGVAAALPGALTLTAAMTGASVGWMVGSWAMMSTMKTKNDPIDSGAQEAPRFNSAVRGSQVPVLFGTNRVPGQITWQANFETIRHDSPSGGGGKAGGSGGGKGAQAVGSTSYSYKIDAVYHMGMSPTPLVLISGWLGGDKITDSSLTGITTNGISFGALNVDGNVGISYDEAVFFPGDINEDDDWAWLTSQVGAPIVWPGTVWAGFKGMDLGGNTAMLQLNFEVGPAGGDIDIDSHPFFRTTGTAGQYVRAMGMDDNLNTYWEDDVSVTDINGTTLFTMTNVQARAFFAAAGVTMTGNPTHTCLHPFGDKFVVTTQGQPTGEPAHIYLFVAVCDIPTAGQVADPVALNYIIVRLGINTFFSQRMWQFNDVYGDPYAMCFYAYDFSGADPWFVSLPTVAEIEAGTYKGTHPGVSGITLLHDECPGLMYEWTHADAEDAALESLNHNCQEAALYNGVGINVFSNNGLSSNQRLYFYMNKSMMQLEGNPGWSYGIATNHGGGPGADGKMFYVDFDTFERIGLHVFGAGNHNEAFAITGPAIEDTSNWVDQEGMPVIPFDDEYSFRVLDGGPVTAIKPPCYSPAASYKYLGGGAYLWIMHMSEQDPTYLATYGKRLQALKIRAFIYDMANTRWVQLGGQPGVLVAQGDLGKNDWHTASNYSLTTPDIIITHYVSGGNIYVQGNLQNDQGYLTLLGNIDLGATDVTPPYIIKEILTNDVFGVQPGADVIDETTYDEAVAYCEANNLKVSTQYRRSSGALQCIELLLSIYGGWLSVDMAAGKIKFGVMDLSNAPVRTIDNNHLIVRNEGDPPVKTSRGALSDTFNIIRINFLDRSQDYQNNQVEARDEYDEDLRGPRMKEFPADFVMSRETAEWMADRALWTNLYIRDAHEFTLGWKDSDLEPGDLITLVDSFTSLNEVAQIVRWKENDRGMYDVLAVQQVPYVSGHLPSQISSYDLASLTPLATGSVGFLNNSGTVVFSGIPTDPSCRTDIDRGGAVPRATYFQAYELPTEFSTKQEVYVGYASDAFAQGANLYVSPDNVTYTSVGNVQPHPIAGVMLSELIGSESQSFAENVEFILHPDASWTNSDPVYTQNVTLNDVTAAGMHTGAGLMYVGSEMLAYTGLELIAQNRYKAYRMYRGWGGTKVGHHGSGDVWWKHGSGLFAREYTLDQIGTTFWYKVSPYNVSGVEYNVSSIVAQTYTIKGQYLRPASPPTLNLSGYNRDRQTNVGSDIDMAMNWEDSARASGWGSGGYGTAPGGYGGFATDTLSHGWRILVTGSGGTVVRSTVVSTTNFTYTRAMNIADNGAWRGNVAFKVTAYSPYGDSTRDSVASMNLFF